MPFMMISSARKRHWPWLILLLVGVVFFAVEAGQILVINAPQRSDLIVVLAGETDRRPALALDLLHQGYATRILLDVPASARIYDATLTQIAADYARKLPVASQIALCPIAGLSTRDESHDVATCLNDEHGATRILLVTSDYHSGRALSIFRHEIRGNISPLLPRTTIHNSEFAGGLIGSGPRSAWMNGSALSGGMPSNAGAEPKHSGT